MDTDAVEANRSPSGCTVRLSELLLIRVHRYYYS